MNNKELTAFDLLVESHLDLDRQGPGSSEMTFKALSFAGDLSKISKVADIGCGTGGQTRVLAEKLDGHITGIDMIADFISIFNEKAARQGLSDKMNGIVGDAFDLPFEKEELDLIWSEGMIDSIGFEKALTYWNTFLKKGGYVAVTSPSWLTTERPADLAKFWTDAGSGLFSVEENIKAMQQSGYNFVSAFALSEECWTQNYYIPRSASENGLAKKYPDNEIVREYIRDMQYEVSLYEKYKEIYGYVFYIGKKM